MLQASRHTAIVCMVLDLSSVTETAWGPASPEYRSGHPATREECKMRPSRCGDLIGGVPSRGENKKWRILPVGEVNDQRAACQGGYRRNAPWAGVSGSGLEYLRLRQSRWVNLSTSTSESRSRQPSMRNCVPRWAHGRTNAATCGGATATA